MCLDGLPCRGNVEVMNKTHERIIQLLENDPGVEITTRSITSNSKTGQEYDRVIYHNSHADIWFVIETSK